MWNIFIILVLVTVPKYIKCQSVIQFINDVPFGIGDSCVTVHNGASVNGVCQSILNCPSVLSSVVDQKSHYHTVCGYDGKLQIICCPSATNSLGLQLVQQSPKLNLTGNLECRIPNSNGLGVMKFLSECPELNQRDASAYINTLCTDQVCSDLVCCPVQLQSRLKKVCEHVDHPREMLELRLLLNQECTVKDLNIKGRYQTECAYAERNSNLTSLLKNVCTDEICEKWYCCPIEDGDRFECSGNEIKDTTAILVGPKCVDSKSGQKGTCKQTYNCRHPDVYSLDNCGSYCCNDFYCCPDNLDTIGESVSIRECNSYIKYLSKQEIEVPMNLYVNRSRCFPITTVAGGIVAKPGEFPHMAALGYRPNDTILWNCGGSLISDRYVLTAGHCLTDRNIGSVQKVRLGVVDLLNDINTADCPEDFDVAKLIPHPQYISSLTYNDIGLVQLAVQVKFNYHMRPICLPQSADEQMYYESMGWGATGTSEDPSVKLIKVSQEIFTYEECRKQYDVGRKYPEGILNDTQICAGSRGSIQSTCPGDSGGPLIVHDNKFYSMFYIQGIVSFGTACGFANSPGVYTKVYPYVKWIEAMVWNN